MAEYVVTKIEDCKVDHSHFLNAATQCECQNTGKIRTDVPLMDVLRKIITTEPYSTGNRIRRSIVQEGDRFEDEISD